MTQRHKDAIMISDGACNPSGVAHALVNACKEIIEERGQQSQDPAVRLIVDQLAYLTTGRQIGTSTDGTDRFDWRRACEESANG